MSLQSIGLPFYPQLRRTTTKGKRGRQGKRGKQGSPGTATAGADEESSEEEDDEDEEGEGETDEGEEDEEESEEEDPEPMTPVGDGGAGLYAVQSPPGNLVSWCATVERLLRIVPASPACPRSRGAATKHDCNMQACKAC